MKKLKQVIASMLVLTMLCGNMLTAFAEQNSYTLTVEMNGKGTVELEGKKVEKTETGYEVQSGTNVGVIVKPDSGYALDSIRLNDETVNEDKFKMPEKESKLIVTFTAKEEKELVNSSGIKVKESLLCDDENCLEEHVGETLDLSELPVSKLKKRSLYGNERMLEDVYVGMQASGYDASVLFLGVPGTSGSFAVNIQDGVLSGISGNGWCINHGAANPGENGATTCSWTAECIEVNGNMATWNFVMTPPGVCDWGSVNGYQRVGMVMSLPFTEAKGNLELIKTSSDPEITNENACYSLEGAVYGLYKDQTEITRLTTDKNGRAVANGLHSGKYTLKEIKAPKGYALDKTAYPVTINSKLTTRVNVKDIPQNDPVSVLLEKQDAETSENAPQGSATLEGAEFTFKYYAGRYKTDPAADGIAANRSWVMKTDARGFTRLDEKYKVSGDEFYKKNGVVTLPLGTLTVQETKAPKGYLINPEIFVRQITADGTTEGVHTYNAPTVKEDIIRGNVEIIKLKENEDSTEETLEGLEGVEFTFTSDTTGEVVKKITTDKYGFATTADEDNPRGGLICDTYTVTETKTPHGYKTIEPFKVTIENDGVTLKGIYKEDKMIVSPVTVVKADASTGKTIPVKNTEFRLLNEKMEPIEMTTNYPNKVTHKTFKTDDNGQFTFPDKLKHGVYYLEEVKAPNGYLKGELLKFNITQYSDWDAPLIVKYANENAMGRIHLLKVDQSTGKPLPAGAEFEIHAAEDIVTPDGTVRAKKGAVVDTIVTGTDSTAESKDLYLGKYLLKETKAVAGYILNEKGTEVELVYKDQDTPVVITDVTVKNKAAMGQVQIDKIDEETGKPIPAGAEFEIRAAEDIFTPDGTIRAEAGEVVDTLAIKENGQVTSKKLYLGNYEVQETKAPDGYQMNHTVFPVSLMYEDQNTPVVSVSVAVSDSLVMGNIQLEKQDEQTGDALAGAVFEIKAAEDIITPDGTVKVEKDNVVDTVTTDDSGRAATKDLYLGHYEVKEIKQPNGYVLSEKPVKVQLKYKDQNTAVVSENILIKNKPTEINISKVNEQGEPIHGVVFRIWNKAMEVNSAEDFNMAVISESKTDKDGKIVVTNLNPGTYCIQEVKADGYVVDQKTYEVTIDENGLVDGKEKAELKLVNKQNAFVLKKKEKDTATPLADVSFKIWNKAMKEDEVDSDMAEVNAYKTDKNGEIKVAGLAPGTYCVKETSTLDGYVLDKNTYEFHVAEDGLVEGKEEYVMELDNDYTKIQISKQDITGQKELPGAHLQVIDKNMKKVVEEWTSTSEPHMIERLKPGIYILHEEAAPNGYLIANDIEFEVKETGDIQKVVMVDELQSEDSIKTGDTMYMLPYILLAIIAAGSLIVTLRIKNGRKRK